MFGAPGGWHLVFDGEAAHGLAELNPCHRGWRVSIKPSVSVWLRGVKMRALVEVTMTYNHQTRPGASPGFRVCRAFPTHKCL